MPPEYELFRAARYLGVPPWELAQQPVWWMRLALTFEAAEAGAERDKEKSRSRKAKKGGAGADGS